MQQWQSSQPGGRGLPAFKNLSSGSEWSFCCSCIDLSALGLLFRLVISLRLLLEKKISMWPLNPSCAAAIPAQLTGWWCAGSAEEGGEYLATSCSACSLSKEDCGEHTSQRTSEAVGFQESVAKACLSTNYDQCESRITLKEILLTLVWSRSFNTECPYCC